MDDIMDNMTRAEYVLLAMRLPREGPPPAAPVEEKKEDEAPTKTEQMDNQVLWKTTTSTPPAPIAKVKPAKKIMSEEEQYKSFIAMVS